MFSRPLVSNAHLKDAYLKDAHWGDAHMSEDSLLKFMRADIEQRAMSAVQTLRHFFS